MPAARAGEWALSIRDFRVRLLEASASGCLLESARPLPSGITARLRLIVNHHTFTEQLQIVRCQAIAGTSAYHLAARFLPAVEHAAGSLRLALRRADVANLSCLSPLTKDRHARRKSGPGLASRAASVRVREPRLR